MVAQRLAAEKIGKSSLSQRGWRLVLNFKDQPGQRSADPTAKPGLIWIVLKGKIHLFGTVMAWLTIQDKVTGQVSAELDMTPPLQR